MTKVWWSSAHRFRQRNECFVLQRICPPPVPSVPAPFPEKQLCFWKNGICFWSVSDRFSRHGSLQAYAETPDGWLSYPSELHPYKPRHKATLDATVCIWSSNLPVQTGNAALHLCRLKHGRMPQPVPRWVFAVHRISPVQQFYPYIPPDFVTIYSL